MIICIALSAEVKHMEISMDKKEFQLVSVEFRRLASRLLKTDFEDALDNLKRFLSYIENTPLIWEFIQEHNTTTFDIEKEIKERNMYEGYNIPLEKSQEIAYIYQLLKYCAENCRDYWSICAYYSNGRKYQDHVDAFNNRVVSAFVSHIEVYLRGKWIEMGDKDEIQITVNGGQVAIAQGQGTVHATQNNNYGQVQDLKALAEEFYKLIESLDIDQEAKEDTKEIVEVAVAEVVSDKPKRSIIKHAIEKIEYAGKIGAGLNGLNTVATQIIEHLQKFL